MRRFACERWFRGTLVPVLLLGWLLLPVLFQTRMGFQSGARWAWEWSYFALTALAAAGLRRYPVEWAGRAVVRAALARCGAGRRLLPECSAGRGAGSTGSGPAGARPSAAAATPAVRCGVGPAVCVGTAVHPGPAAGRNGALSGRRSGGRAAAVCRGYHSGPRSNGPGTLPCGGAVRPGGTGSGGSSLLGHRAGFHPFRERDLRLSGAGLSQRHSASFSDRVRRLMAASRRSAADRSAQASR